MPQIETLVSDIYDVVLKGKEPSEEHLNLFAENCKNILRTNLTKGLDPEKKNYLRMSAIGTPDRKLWFSMNRQEKQEPYTAKNLLSFAFGNIIEEFALLLSRHAGHLVTDEQKRVSLNGVDGSLDCKIDGVTTDSKSASPFNFKKFSTGSIFKEDSFGYLDQVSGYVKAEGERQGAFLVFNKVDGELHLLHLENHQIRDAAKRIEHCKVVIKQPEPPKDLCYQTVKQGKSGNEVIAKNCEFCNFKKECFKEANNGQGLREFAYSTGKVYFSKIVREPRVRESVSEEFDV